ncbi:hypothetical protein, partial [Streptomyces sp. NPDC048442]|uniref:hypothetical protein n=1 Tax=Streptomyces sp. NPDC048442 TaxID=3154823 RepID=UPI0034424627
VRRRLPVRTDTHRHVQRRPQFRTHRHRRADWPLPPSGLAAAAESVGAAAASFESEMQAVAAGRGAGITTEG